MSKNMIVIMLVINIREPRPGRRRVPEDGLQLLGGQNRDDQILLSTS